MSQINEILFKLGLKLLKRKNDKLDTILDPLHTMIQLAVLSVCPVHTKLSISNNNVYLQKPLLSQSIVRWYQDDKFQDLFYIFNSCKLFSTFYKKKLVEIKDESNNLYHLLIHKALEGIDLLIQTYSFKKNNHVTELLKLYKFILTDNGINTNPTSEQKELNKVFVNINSLYSKNELYSIFYLLLTSRKNKSYATDALDTFLSEKRRQIQNWIHKNMSI